MWGLVNDVAGALVGAWLRPVGALPEALRIAWLAVPVAGLALLAYRFASSQRAIARAQDGVVASLLELRLHRDDLRVVLGAQGRLLGHALGWLAHSLPPIGVMLVPFALVLAQVEARFAWRAPAPGEPVIVTALVEPAAWPGGVMLELDDGIARDTPPLRVESANAVHWRVRALAPGDHRVAIRAGGGTAARLIVAGETGVSLCPEVRRADDALTLACPAESPLPAAGPVIAIRVDYPRARGVLLGLSSASWWLTGFAILFALLARGRGGVTF